MKILSVEIKDCCEMICTLNIRIALLIVIVLGISLLVKLIRPIKRFKAVHIEEATIGIGNSSIVIKCDNKIQEIAYKIWVELQTRKIGILFDEKNDIITEVYDSWYQAFCIIREDLKDLPILCLKNSAELVDLTLRVLNTGLRPHLTKWQAKFRKWFEEETSKGYGLTPQDIQHSFPEYETLVKEIVETNHIMIGFSEELKKIAFGVNGKETKRKKYKGI